MIDLAQIAGQQLIRDAEASGDDVQLRSEPFADPRRGRRLVELDVLAAPRIGDDPRLELLEGLAVRVNDGRGTP